MSAVAEVLFCNSFQNEWLANFCCIDDGAAQSLFDRQQRLQSGNARFLRLLVLMCFQHFLASRRSTSVELLTVSLQYLKPTRTSIAPPTTESDSCSKIKRLQCTIPAFTCSCEIAECAVHCVQLFHGLTTMWKHIMG